MELLVASGIALLGYALRGGGGGQESRAAIRTERDWDNDRYQSNNVATATRKAEARARENFEAREPREFSRFAAQAPLRDELLIEQPPPSASGGTVRSALSGQPVPVESFVRNRQPYYAGNLKSAPDEGAASALMHAALGTVPPSARSSQSKSEALNMGDVRMNAGNVHGLQSFTDFEQGRMERSASRAMERPFESVLVGPGLGSDAYESLPASDRLAQQRIERAAILPKTVDELRYASHPKASFAARTVAGQLGSNRAENPNVGRNRPDLREEHPQELLPTGGMYTQPNPRAPHEIRETFRSQDLAAAPLPAPRTAETLGIPAFYRMNAAREAMGPAPSGQAVAAESGRGFEDDYGRGSMRATRRQLAGTDPWIGGAASSIQAAVAPFAESLRLSSKEMLLTRHTGNERIQVQRPAMSTTFDPEDTTRTTLRETSIHDTRVGALGGFATGHTVHDPEDAARTTMKDTAIHDTWEGVLSAPRHRPEAYDPETYRPQTTLKDTSIHDTREGQIRAVAHAVAQRADDAARITSRQTLVHERPVANLAPAAYRQVTHDPLARARSTVRDTTLYQPDTGGASGPTRHAAGDELVMRRSEVVVPEGRAYVNAGNRSDGYMVAPSDLRFAPRARAAETPYELGGASAGVRKAALKIRDERTATESGALRSALNVAYHAPTPSARKVANPDPGRTTHVPAVALYSSDLRVQRASSLNDSRPGKICAPSARPQPGTRIDQEILDAYRKNPFTKPLDSVA